MQARIAVIMGGPSSEHDISLVSGRQVVGALRDEHVVVVRIDKDGTWNLDGVRAESMGRALDELKRRVDVVFVAMHGPFGEDGTVQGLLDAIGLPYTGTGVMGSALAMDKARTKLVYRAADLPTPRFEWVDRQRWGEARDEILVAIAALGWPCALKPTCSGSSVGMSFPEDSEQAAADVDALLAESDGVLAEAKVVGREFTCGVLDVDGAQLALPITEIIPGAEYAFFDYEAKYKPGATAEITPADIPDRLAAKMQVLAKQAHRVLGCRDFSRTDYMVGADGAPTILETNTIPGLTPQSLLPQAAAEAGYDFRALIRLLIDNALSRAA